MNNKFGQKISLTIFCAALCGCMVGPDFEKPQTDSLTQNYVNTDTERKRTDSRG